MAPVALCESCEKIDFKAAGLHSPGDEAYNFFALDDVPLSTTLESAHSCGFCARISSFILAWLRRRYGVFDNVSVFEVRSSVGALRIKSIDGEAEQNEAESSLFRISANYTVKDPSSGELLGPSLTFQKCATSPELVSSAVEHEDVDWSDVGERYLGRIRPLQIDLRLLRKWKKSCLLRHGELCVQRLRADDAMSAGIRVIDAQRLCLADLEPGMRWLALSYCWGDAAVFTLQKHDLQKMHTPGILSELPIPRIILEAIQVTLAIGERYLWVDSICIVQNDVSEKQAAIPLMNEIYSASILTIVDAAGGNPNHGLCGVSAGSRSSLQQPFQVGEITLVEVLDPVNVFDASGIVSDSKWSSRAWTFQEGLLPTRLLVFTAEQVYWQCSQSSWCEDGCWEYFDGDIIYRHSHSDELRDLWSSDDNGEKSCRRLVELYSQRAMSHASDGLNAISGVLKSLEERFGIEFIWGMPSKWLGAALTWPTEHDPYSVIRRSAYTLFDACETGGKTRTVRCAFPSWSWVGWKGKILFDELYGLLESRHAGIVFHTIDSAGSVRVIVQHTDFKEKYAPRDEDQLRRLAALANCPAWRDDTRTQISTEDLPEAVFSDNAWAVTLAFWSSVVIVDIQNVNEQAKRFEEVHHLYHRGTKLEVMWDQYLQPEVCEKQGDFLLVVIGRDTLSHIRSKDQLVAIITRCDRQDGLSERCGAASINEEDWIAMPDREWRKVFLV